MNSLVQAQSRGRLLSPWLLAGLLLTAMVGLNVFIWWIELSLDPSLVSAAEPAFEPIIRYVGLEFTGDSVGFAIAIVVSAVVLSRDRSNRFAWVFGAFSSFWMVAMVLVGLAMLSSVGRLPVDYAPWFAAVGAPFFLTFITGTFLLVALFPTGSFPPGIWRPMLRVAFACWGVVALLATFRAGSPYAAGATPYSFSNPLGVSALAWVSGDVIDIGQAVVALLALASLVGRYRMADSEVRTQIKWVVAGMAFLTATSLLMELIDTPWEGYPVTVALWLTVAAIGVAILKYRLYEIDLIINRAVVYGSLALFIGVVYVSIVVGVGTLLGFRDESNPALSIAATALVAIGFQPARRRLERFANRLVFGRKATPYEVLSEFSRRVAATDESLLGAVARSLVEGTSANRAAVSVWIGEQLVESAVWPEMDDAPSGEKLTFPIEHEGVELGVLTLMSPNGQQLSDEDAGLAGQVASGMGLALKNRLLTERLQSRVEDLRESRRRLVAVQDETRRKLERDLHDGAQQQLVALKVKLGLSRMIAEKEGASEMVDLLSEIGDEANDAVESLRRFARGVYPPLLEAEGLASAVTAHARNSGFPVVVESNGIGRYPKEIESTVYFCVLEALRSPMGMPEPVQATVKLAQLNGSVTFEIRQEREGPDAASESLETRVVGMRDRIDALAGTLKAVSLPGEGTLISGAVPVRPQVTA